MKSFGVGFSMTCSQKCPEFTIYFVCKHSQQKSPYLLCFLLCAGMIVDLLCMVLDSDFPVDFGVIAFCWVWFWCPLMGMPDPHPTIPQSPCNAGSRVTNSVLSDSRFWFLPWQSLDSTSGKKFNKIIRTHSESSIGIISLHSTFTVICVLSELGKQLQVTFSLNCVCTYVFACPEPLWAWETNLTSQIKFH